LREVSADACHKSDRRSGHFARGQPGKGGLLSLGPLAGISGGEALVRNPGIQFKVWVLMTATAVIACFLAFEIFLFEVATREIVSHGGAESWSEIFVLWIAMNLPIVVVPLLVAYAYLQNRKYDDVDRQRDEDGN
jgi:hypothetical protein